MLSQIALYHSIDNKYYVKRDFKHVLVFRMNITSEVIIGKITSDTKRGIKRISNLIKQLNSIIVRLSLEKM